MYCFTSFNQNTRCLGFEAPPACFANRYISLPTRDREVLVKVIVFWRGEVALAGVRQEKLRLFFQVRGLLFAPRLLEGVLSVELQLDNAWQLELSCTEEICQGCSPILVADCLSTRCRPCWCPMQLQVRSETVTACPWRGETAGYVEGWATKPSRHIKSCRRLRQ